MGDLDGKISYLTEIIERLQFEIKQEVQAKVEIARVYEEVMKNTVHTFNQTMGTSKITTLRDKTLKPVTLIKPN